MFSDVLVALETTSSVVLADQYDRIVREHPNPLSRCGGKVFSQTDEDGVTYEILKRIGLEKGVFAEFGVGNGLENSTILLASLGWKGFWAGGEQLAYPIAVNERTQDFVFEDYNLDTRCVPGARCRVWLTCGSFWLLLATSGVAA